MLGKQLRIPLYWPTLILFIALTIFFAAIYYITDENSNPKLATLVGGFTSAFLVASLQLMVNIFDAIKLSKYISTGVIEILTTRKDPKYYEKIIRESKTKIYLIGVTASRFMDDFAAAESSQGKVPALQEALTKGVKIKILLPKLRLLNDPQQSDFKNKTWPRYETLKRTPKNNIELRFYDHIPLHSIVSTESISIVGPMFPERESKNTQSLVLKTTSQYAEQYLQHFEEEWEKANEKYE